LSATQQLLRFGVFELNLDTEELRKSEILLKLPPQPFRLLVLLASRAGQIVGREDIRREFWSEETDIDFERRMNQGIKQIRTALGDNAGQPLYLETVHRQGYRFIAPVESKIIPTPRPKVVHSESGERTRAQILIGSGAGAPAVAGAVAPSYPAVAPDAEGRAKPESETVDIHQSGPRVWRARVIWCGAALVLLGLIAGVFYRRSHRAQVLTDKDTIVLADFDNKTGDSVFDDTLKQALAIQLEQSPFLNVLSDRKAAGTLKLMNRSGSERLTEDLAREICLRTNSKAMLIGSIVKLGSQYVIGVKATDCSTGDVLAEAQEQAAGKAGVLKALDAAAVNLRSKLGESLSSVQKYATPLREATTPSLEALKAYSLGQKTALAKGDTASLPFFRRAVELDPNFAVAYTAMASGYNNLNEIGRSAQNARKAYELRERVSERERFFIEAFYYMLATGELDKAAQVYELWQQSYPRDHSSYTNLVFISGSLGNWDKASEEAREVMRLEPNDAMNYVNLGNSYASLNQLDKAEAVYKQAEDRKMESEGLLQYRYQLAFLTGDMAHMAQIGSAAMGQSGTEDVIFAEKADTEGWYGRLRGAREMTGRAMDSAQRNDAKETAAAYQAAAALREVESGNREQARRDARAAAKLAPNRDVRAMAALAMARAGDTAGAKKLMAELDQALPLDTLVQRYWLPTIQAAIALDRTDPKRAVELLQLANLIELGQPTQVSVILCPVYMRGEAYLMLHDGNAAAVEFQKFIDHYGLVVNFPWGALARLGLARAYALDAAKDLAAHDKALAAYHDFLTLWKDADRDVPVYRQANAEYRKLQ
jgi:DNA-binding winged helix-turn-helix (wHTH) protein/tetratricopeptide (TPR) repeat protein